ncbi:hypothetical protein LLG96_06765 [bacterium]|nr:hypothetical protein [bacterium]
MSDFTHVNFLETDIGRIKAENKFIDSFVDLSGHVTYQDNNTNFYFWGKDPLGGGNIIYGSYENIELQGLKQRALKMISSSNVSLVMNVEIKCTAISAQRLCVGIIDIKSEKYNHIGEKSVNGLTTVGLSKKFDFKKNQDFVLIVWQGDIGDFIHIFDQNNPNWKNVVNFSFH